MDWTHYCRIIVSDSVRFFLQFSSHTNELFNMADRTRKLIDNWSLDGGYSSLTNKSYPLRVFGSGTRDGLMITFSLNRSEFDDSCRSHVQGFKIQLHMPGVVPQLSKHYFHMPMKRDLLISVNPQVIRTDEDLESYSPAVYVLNLRFCTVQTISFPYFVLLITSSRQCYFSNEKWLQFFSNYTKQNCDFECLTNYTLEKCECVRFSMPRTGDTKICGIKKIDCCNNAEDELLRKDDGLLGSNEFDDCNCLPSCTSYSYNMEQSHNIITSQSEYNLMYSKVQLKVKCFHFNSIFSEKELAVVRIFFNKKQFITSKRSKLYGQTELLANFGGLLGFFLGISLLSIVEIIYFFTLRVYLLVNRKISPKDSDRKVTAMKSNINIIQPSKLNAIDRQCPIAKNGKNLFGHQ